MKRQVAFILTIKLCLFVCYGSRRNLLVAVKLMLKPNIGMVYATKYNYEIVIYNFFKMSCDYFEDARAWR